MSTATHEEPRHGDGSFSFPKELLKLPQWVCWKRETNAEGKTTKAPRIPHDPRGPRASSTNPSNWTTYAKARLARDEHKFDGVGFVFTAEDLYAGVDLDHARDPATGTLTPDAQAIIDSLNSYTELSPSGRGVHIIVRGSLPAAYKRDGVEMYDRARYFTVTGQHLEGTPTTVEDRSAELLALYTRLAPLQLPQPEPKNGWREVTLDDDAVLEAALKAANGDKVRRLMDGDISMHGNDDSRADMALAACFAFYTRDAEQIGRLMRRSKLARSKWNKHRTYLADTIKKALTEKPDTPKAAPTPHSINEVIEVARRHLIPDPNLIRLLLATVLVNKCVDLNPLWLFIIAPPSSGKTEHIIGLSDIPEIYPLSDLTPNTLVSGWREDGAASLLPELDGKIITFKEFTTVLTMFHDARQAILSQLREVYDGSYKKRFGTGREIDWHGHVGFIAGVTEAIDTHYSVYQLLGERFVQYRLASPDSEQMAGMAIDRRKAGASMHQELCDAFAGFFAMERPSLLDVIIPSAVRTELVQLSTFVARARSAIMRDPHKRDIEFIPDPELPGRLAKQLANLATGLAVVDGQAEVTAANMAVVAKVALDSLTKGRLRVLKALFHPELGQPTTKRIAVAINSPTTTTRRTLEDLTALGVLVRSGEGSKSMDTWKFVEKWKPILAAALERIGDNHTTELPVETTNPLDPDTFDENLPPGGFEEENL